MLITRDQHPASLAADELVRIQSLVDEGLCLRAFESARGFGKLETWRGTRGRLLAGRLAPHLGAPRLGTAIHRLAWREDSADPELCHYRAYYVLGRRGPLAAWRFLQKIGPLDGAPDSLRSDWLASHAMTLARLRDFDAAETWLARAERLSTGRAWHLIARADLYELEDRYEDALAAGRESLTLKPWYFPAIEMIARLLQLLNREEEALELMAEACERIESAIILAQHGVLLDSLRRHSDARRAWDRFCEHAPLIEPRMRRWLAGRRCDSAYACGDIPAAVALARESREPFFLAIAARLEDPEQSRRRVLLAVGFVRQHHQTCVPATLAAIARYWGVAVDHRAVADLICYDGTPNHRERSWAEQNGFLALEFTVTWTAAIALLDRGIPFTLTTVETQSAHVQAVIGYDEWRGTLLIRDPTLPTDGEVLVEPFLARYCSVGPRGMALVPLDKAHLALGLELPESCLYDELYRLQVALRGHDRERAGLSYDALRAGFPGHRLELVARQVLAYYDGDAAGMLAAVEELLNAFPDDVNLRLSQLGYLHMLGRRDERLARYRELCSRPTADPILCRQYARELELDARERENVVRLIDRALRARPLDATSLWILANARWNQGRLEEATELYRFATCLNDKDEGLAQSYWTAARHLHREHETLRVLEGRFRRHGTRSALPARTLYWAFSQTQRMSDAFAVLEVAVRLRPGDGDLLRFVAEAHAAHGDFEKAAQCLTAAEGLCRHGNWMRTIAHLASIRGDLTGALDLWLQVLDAEPWALDANREAARLLTETSGRPAAHEHLARACERLPHNYSLLQTRIEWLRDGDPAAVEPAVRQLLEIHPAAAWAQRELALSVARQGRHAEARTAMDLASQLDPSSSVEAHFRGAVLAMAGHRDEARSAYRDAIRRSVDNEFAIARLIDSCSSRASRIEALAFIGSELSRQVIFGDGLLAFASRARDTLEPDDLLATLRKAHEARPDLWHAWSALINELSRRGKRDEAIDLAKRAVDIFPLLPRIWFDLGMVHRARDEADLEVEAVSRALRISPGWSEASRQLAATLEKDGNYHESRAVLERAIAHAPLDAANHACLAHALWYLDEKELAIERSTVALRLKPDYDWAWDFLRFSTSELGLTNAPVELARCLAETRAGDPNVGLRLAFKLFDLELQGRELDAASAVLETLKTNHPSEYVDAREVQLALAQNDLATASAVLARLCKAPLITSEWPLESATKAFVDHGFAHKAEAIFEKALEEPGTHSLVGDLWVKRCAARNHWRIERRLAKLRQSSEAVGRRATLAFFQSLGNAKQSFRIRAGIRRSRQALRNDTRCWGIVGFCLLAINRHRDLVQWMADWADRDDAEGWMLNNLMLSLRAIGNDAEANRVSRFALTLPRDYSTSFHELWLIVDDLLAGPCPDALERMGRLDRSRLKDTDDLYLLGLAALLAEFRQSAPESRRDAVWLAGRNLAVLGRRSPIARPVFPILRGCYHHVIALISKEKAGLPGLCWWLWRRLNPPIARF